MTGYTLKGITPQLGVETREVQSSTPTPGSKFNKDSGKMSEQKTGVCASLVAFWLSREAEGNPVRSATDFPSGFTLQIAYGAGWMSFGNSGNTGFLERFGMKIVTTAIKNKKWYSIKSTKVEQAISQSIKMPGLYYIVINGDGAHAVGVSSAHYAQFFDPNFGVFTFKSLADMKTWVPAFIVRTYPDMLERTELFGVG